MRRAILLITLLALTLAPNIAAAEDGVKVFLASATNVNTAAFDPNATTASLTLPLFKGIGPDGSATWYVVTESSDKNDAERRGVNWSPKLAHALNTAAVQKVTVSGGLVTFAGGVDFTPEHIVVAGPNGFPPDTFQAGSKGDTTGNYTPLITTGNGVVLNAPQVANATGLHDKVVSIDFAGRRVSLRMTNGFYHDNRILYISFDASNPLAAALESATFAPNLDAAPGLGSNDKETSARSSIIPIVNGATGATNPQRQGLASAILDKLDPLNITIVHPGGDEYSPLWDVHAAVWTDAAIASGQRVRLTHHDQVADAVQKGLIVSAFNGPANPDLGGLRAAGFIVNCPIMAMRS